MQGIGLRTGTPPGAARFPTVLAQRPDLSTATPRLLEDMLNPAVRAAPARAPSAGTARADRRGAIRHAEVGASVAGQRAEAVELTAAVAGIDNRRLLRGAGSTYSPFVYVCCRS